MASNAFDAPSRKVQHASPRPSRPLAALSEGPNTTRYEAPPPPCQRTTESTERRTNLPRRGIRPLIGISCYLEQSRFGLWDLPAAVLPHGYLDGVVHAGGTPVLLPPVGTWSADHLSRMDGLIIAGGADIDPSCYGAAREAATGPARSDRDSSEQTLVELALRMGVPLLGVCRGMQLLNVVLGGTLHQHLPDQVGNTDHLPVPGTFGRVPVKITPGSRLARIVGDQVEVRCHHHQAVDRLGDGLVAVASAGDGTIEGVELTGKTFVVGVQWHPEEDNVDRRLFEALVREAGR